jgi:hypothetical protein
MKKSLSVVNNDVVDVGPKLVKKTNILIDYSSQDAIWNEGLQNYENPPSIEHKDIRGYKLNGPYLVVLTSEENEAEYIYPMASVTFIKFTVDTVEE